MSKMHDEDVAICARKIKALQEYIDWLESQLPSLDILGEFRPLLLRQAILDANKIDT